MELHERLRMAREHAGYSSAVEAALALGVPYQTYVGHENGNSGFKNNKGALYARRFKVRFEWLMLEVGAMTDLSSKHQNILADFDSLPSELQDSYARILKEIAEPYKGQQPDQAPRPVASKSA